MMAHDPSLLAGGAALHALDPDEQEQFDLHVVDCAICSAELFEFRETAARLGAASATAAPAALRSAVLAGIAMTRQLPPDVSRSADDARSGEGDSPHRADEVMELSEPRLPAVSSGEAGNVLPFARKPKLTVQRLRMVLIAAAVAAVLAVGSVFVFNNNKDQVADPRRACLISASDQQTVKATPVSVGSSAVTVSASCGAALVQLTKIPAAPAGSTYQLWVLAGTHARSVAVMEPDSNGTMPEVVAPVQVGDTAIGVTVEPTGGSPAPTTDPVILVPLV